jgi:hypothetical protein
MLEKKSFEIQQENVLCRRTSYGFLRQGNIKGRSEITILLNMQIRLIAINKSKSDNNNSILYFVLCCSQQPVANYRVVKKTSNSSNKTKKEKWKQKNVSVNVVYISDFFLLFCFFLFTDAITQCGSWSSLMSSSIGFIVSAKADFLNEGYQPHAKHQAWRITDSSSSGPYPLTYLTRVALTASVV